MLQSLRQHASSWIMKVLFAFLILSFGLWGINDIFLGERDPAVAKVGGSKIARSQLDEAFRQEIAQYRPLFGGSLEREQAKQIGLLDQALDKLIDRAVFAGAVRDFGLIINDDMIRRHIQQERAFHNAAGQFDRNVFHQVLASHGLNESSYVSGLRRDLATNQLIGAVTAATPAPSNLIESLHRYREEGRIVDIIVVPADQSPTPPVPEDATLAEYYQANRDRFTAPELRSISYVALDAAAMAQDAAVPEERLKQEYESRIGDYTVRERRDVDQVVLRDEAAAQRVRALLEQGQSLTEAVTQLDDKPEVVKLGWVERADLIGELAEPAFALQAGQHSMPIKSPLGWHVLVVNGVEPGGVKPFEEVRDALRKALAEHQAAEEAYELAIRLEDVLATGATLDEAATQVGLKTTELPAIDANGFTPDGKPAPNLPADPRFLQAAFSTPEGQESQLLELPRNVFAVVRVEKVTPPMVKPLEEVKADAIALWQEEQRMDAARKRAESIVERIKKGEPTETVAAAEGLQVTTTPVFTRLTHDSETGLPDALKAQLFDLKVGAAGLAEANGGYVVARLKEVRPAPELPADVRANLSTQLSQAIGGDILDQLATTLRARYDVEIRRDVLDSRF